MMSTYINIVGGGGGRGGDREGIEKVLVHMPTLS